MEEKSKNKKKNFEEINREDIAYDPFLDPRTDLLIAMLIYLLKLPK